MLKDMGDEKRRKNSLQEDWYKRKSNKSRLYLYIPSYQTYNFATL